MRKRQRYVATIYALIAHRYNLLDVKERVARVVAHRRFGGALTPVEICDCALPRKWKEVYAQHLNDIRLGRPRVRTKGAL